MKRDELTAFVRERAGKCPEHAPDASASSRDAVLPGHASAMARFGVLCAITTLVSVCVGGRVIRRRIDAARRGCARASARERPRAVDKRSEIVMMRTFEQLGELINAQVIHKECPIVRSIVRHGVCDVDAPVRLGLV